MRRTTTQKIAPIRIVAIAFISLLLANLPTRCATGQNFGSDHTQNPVTARQVVDHYVAMAHCRYEDSLEAARALTAKAQSFIQSPDQASYQELKEEWIRAHCIYSHTEVFRFGNPNVDAWESKVNAWPMDEGLIDYVSENYVFHKGNPHAKRNIIQNGKLPITDELISEYHDGTDPKAAPITSITDIESNVATGFHAVEFLLWGQDLSTDIGATGQRSYTDYLLTDKATNGFNSRRRNYLMAAVGLIGMDLRRMVADWNPKGRLYAKTFRQLDTTEQLNRMLLGMGSLCYAELGVERMRVALMTNDQEEEENCFSDTTLLAIHHNAASIETLYHGFHKKMDGTEFTGPSLAQLVAQTQPDLDAEIQKQFQKTRSLTESLVNDYRAGKHFDWMIRAENSAGRRKIKTLIQQLMNQAMTLEKIQKLTPELAKQ